MAMYRVDEGVRRVLALHDPELDAIGDVEQSQSAPSQPVEPPTSRPEPSKTSRTSTKSSFILPAESEAPDVLLHADGCALALHLSVLQERCPGLYKQLRLLRHARVTKDVPVTLQLLDAEELQLLRERHEMDADKCPLEDAETLRLDYVRCAVHRRGRCSQEDSPVAIQKRKRLRRDPDATAIAIAQKSRRVRSLFSEEDALKPVALIQLNEQEKQRRVMHVKVDGTNLKAIVTAVEYIYRLKVRVIDARNAMEAVKVGEWLGMRSTMRYYCLVRAVRHVETTTWMQMLLAVSKLDDKVMRHVLGKKLVLFVKSLKPEQYYQALTDMPTVHISRLKYRDILIQAVVGLTNSIRLVEFWRNLLDAVSTWLCYHFQTPQVPSLRAIHHHFAPEWKPYMEREPMELDVIPGEGNLFTLLEFGKFQLQVRIDITDEMPMLWRIIRSSSPQLLTQDPDQLTLEALQTDPEFWLRGHMRIKYWRAQPNRGEVSQEVFIEYQHCYKQYSQWADLVPPSPLSMTPVASSLLAVRPDGVGKAQFRGKFFIWGNPVCSIYHFLLQTTLFYSAPHGASTEFSDLMVVSEMQRLPLETLVLVLRSDRLRIPEGERTLLRCLNKLVFGNNFSYLGSSNQVGHGYNGRRKDVIRLFKCVRWCFVPMEDILATLQRSPRELKLFEVIEMGLQDTFRRFLRRRPWGWRKYRHPYRINESNVAEFRIEAGDCNLSPEYFAEVLTKAEPCSQDSILLSSPAVYCDPPSVQIES